jgi:hypothetical protein
VSFLRDRQSRFPPADQPKRVEPETKSIRHAELPLLTKVSGPDERPVYRSTFRPRPLPELNGGTRRVPVLEEANGGIPFLRISKPQSHYLGSYIRRKSARRQKQHSLYQQLSDDSKLEAQEEDRWEDELVRLAAEEGVQLEGHHWVRHTPYEQSVKLAMDYVGQKLSSEMDDMKARAVAMLDIVDEEKRLAAEEEKERKRMKRWERNARRRQKPRGRQRDAPGSQGQEEWDRRELE